MTGNQIVSGKPKMRHFFSRGGAERAEKEYSLRLAIHLAAVPDTVDAYDANLVSNLVNQAVVTYTDAPVILAKSSGSHLNI
jgi:hypothetical protein